MEAPVFHCVLIGTSEAFADVIGINAREMIKTRKGINFDGFNNFTMRRCDKTFDEN